MENVILTNKKRYLSALSLSETADPYLDVKGIEVARRDNCQMVVKTMKTLLDKLILGNDRKGALEIISDTLRELLGGRVDISDLVITKAITKEEYAGKPAHVAVSEKMKRREPSYICGCGDRVPFVVTSNGGKKLFEKADDPLWVINHGILSLWERDSSYLHYRDTIGLRLLHPESIGWPMFSDIDVDIRIP